MAKVVSMSGLVAAGSNLRLFADVGKPQNRVIKKHRDTVLVRLSDIKEDCENCALPMSLVAICNLIERVGEPLFTYQILARRSDEIVRRMRDELDTRLFLAVNTEHAPYFEDFAERWEAVITKFPSVAFDIKEASKCFALNRYTACVFHLMRIGEAGLTAIAQHVGYEEERPGWEPMIGYLHSQLKHNPEDMDALFRGDIEFLNGVVAHMRNVKIAWRNRVAHIESKYTEEEAEQIYVTTKVLMEHITTSLPETEDE